MPDISMCSGLNCPLKETCYRYKATPSFHQSYFMPPPLKEDTSCDYYWKIRDEEQIRTLDLKNDINNFS